jgi:hypothetical protein
VSTQNAHPVLDINGRLQPGFHWADPKDDRDVRIVLKEDRIRFDESGSADSSQRMRADGLAALMGEKGFEQATPEGEATSPAG